ncbi:MAG: chemotaxis protein CheW, partial [Terracidiphilus sp.]
MDDLIREFLIESQEGLDRMERCLTELEAQPADAALIGEIFRSVHTIKGTTGFLGFARLEKLAHAGENLLGLVREGAVPASALVITELLRLLDGLRAILRSIEADGSEGEGDDAALIGRLEELPAAVAETSRATTAPAPENAARRETPAGGAGPESSSATESSLAAESTLRVDVVLLNRLMNLVGELVLTRNQVLQATAADARMTHLSRRLDMVTADLREAVMKARMQPVSQVFSKMPRLVRDLAQLLGRRVRLDMKGQQTELDKSLLEAIKDPLTHAVRNALDHGIEPPAVREAAGKSPEGTLTLRAMHQGSHVLIEIADDGAGIAVERVRSKAIERGLIEAAQASELSEGEVLQLIFLPGFSTASAVTTVSGRGVGMDVVRTNVEKIGGRVEIDSTVGKGTAIRLRIPLTLAIIPALIVHSGGENLALPQGALSELVRVAHRNSAPQIGMNQIGETDSLHQFEQIGQLDQIDQIEQIEWIGDAAVFRLRDRLLPLVFLDRLLGLEGLSERDGSPGRDRFIVVLDVDGRRFGLVVDGLADPEEIVVKPLSAALKGIGLFSGATILGNGGLALILDPAAVALRARIYHNAEASAVPSPAAAAEADHAQEYLLVDAGGRRAALPLGDVLRIDRLKASRIEQVGTRLVLHTAGELLPVEDIGGVFGRGLGDPDAPVIVVVCGRRRPHFGVLVSDLLDVAKGSALVVAGTASAAEGVTLLADRVTGIVCTDSLSIGMSLPEPEPLAMTAIAEVQP